MLSDENAINLTIMLSDLINARIKYYYLELF